AFLRIFDGLTALDHGESEVQRVASKDVAHRRAADDDHFEAGLVGDALESCWAHLARTPDGEAVASDDERLAAVNALAEGRHQGAERPSLPARIEGVEAFRNSVVGGRDLIRVDRVELSPGHLGIPEDERLPADQLAVAGAPRSLEWRVLHVRARDDACPFDRLHDIHGVTRT